MIKVNLNKTKSSVIYDTKETGLGSSDTFFQTAVSTVLTNIKKTNVAEASATALLKIVINFILVLCFPLALKVYEVNQIKELEKQKSKKEQLLAAASGELSRLETELRSYDHLQAKAEEYRKKKEFLKKLAESRLIIPRTIDLIQNKTPKTVWLEELRLEISERGQKVHITGKSFNEAHVNFFANSLHDVLDKNSITVDTQDIREGNSVVKVDFNLKGTM